MQTRPQCRLCVPFLPPPWLLPHLESLFSITISPGLVLPSLCVLHWPESVFMSVHPLSSCPSASSCPSTGQAPGVTVLYQAGVSSEKLRGCRALDSGCDNYLSLGFSMVEQAAWGGFPLLGTSDRACWSEVEKQKSTLSLHPSLRRKRQTTEVAGIRWQALEEQQRVGWWVGGQSTPISPVHT